MTDFHLQNAHISPILPSTHRNQEKSSGANTSSVRKSKPVIRFTIVFLIVSMAGLAAWPFLPRRYEASVSLILRATEEAGPLGHSQALKQLLDEGAVQSELDIMASLPLSNEVMERLGLADDPEFNALSWGTVKHEKKDINDPAREIANHVIVSRDRKSYTVKLGYWSRDPAKAVLMANTLASVYLDRQIKFKLERNAELMDQMKSRLVELASRGALMSRIFATLDDDRTRNFQSNDIKNVALVEFESVRQRLMDINEQRTEIHPDAELVADAMIPLGAAFPNPIMLAASTLLIAIIAALLSIWKDFSTSFSDEFRLINEVRSRQ